MFKRKAVTGMYKQKAILNIELAFRVAEAIKNAPEVFENPIPTVDALQTAADQANKSFNLAQGGSNAQRNKFKTDMTTLKELLNSMCDYVNCIAKGDSDKILLSGFALSKLREPRPAPVAAQKLKVEYVNIPGHALPKWEKSKNHSFYILQVTTDPSDNNSWKEVTTLTARQYMVSNLSSGKTHYFRVISVGTKGKSATSDMASIMVA